MLKKAYSILALLLMTSFYSGYAQGTRPIISAKFVPDSITIGDQFELEVTIDKSLMQVVEFPIFTDNRLGDVIEILSESSVDTVTTDGQSVKLQKKYLLTIFDEGSYSLGKLPMFFADKNIIDTIWSEDSMFLHVATFEIDTTKQTIHDIKRPMEAPMKFGEVSGYILWGCLAALLIGLLIYYIVRRLSNRPLIGKKKEILPPHVIAIKALEELKYKKIWQSSKHKLYYTSLIDILREYIEGRYGVHAMEMTSDEIILALKDKELSSKNIDELKDLLSISDLVKFAKVLPNADQNEGNYDRVYYFVEDTKSIESEVINKEEIAR